MDISVDAPEDAPARTRVAGRSLVVWVGVLLVACTLGARVPAAIHYALWQDEIGTEHVIAEPTVGKAVQRVINYESTPPTFYLAARVADRALSGLNLATRARATRGLSIAFSVGCTALALLLALEFLPLWGAALAALLASFASELVIYGSELRAYSLFAFMCVAFALALTRAAREPTVRRLALLAFTVALGSMSHYFFLFTFAAGVLWLVTASRNRSDLLRVGGALAVGLIPLAVWSPYWLQQFRNGHYGTAPPVSFTRVVEILPSLFIPEQVVQKTPEAISVLATLAVLVAAAFLVVRRPGTGRLCALCVLVPFFVISVMAWVSGKRVYDLRNHIGLTPFAAIALVWGCAAVPWRRVGYLAGIVVGALVLAGFTYSQVGLGRTPFNQIANDLIAQGFRTNEPVVWFGVYGTVLPTAWYLTLDEPPDTRMRIRMSVPNGKACRLVEVVATDRNGRQWLARHASTIVTHASTPYYGATSQEGRGQDVIVAQLRWSRGVLDRPPRSPHWFLFHQAGSLSPCLAGR